MADQRTCYAGDLTSDAIGKTVKVEVDVTAGKVSATFNDRVREIRHVRRQGKTLTVIHFETARSTSSRDEGGVAMPHTQLVEVLP